MAKKKTASLDPETFVDGGGLIDDVDATINKARFDLYDYNGTVDPPVPALKLDLETEDGEEVEQYYSMGSAADWAPSKDGSQLEAIGKATAIRTTTNGGLLLKALLDAGFPADDLGDDITSLDGMVAHFVQIPQPARTGLKQRKRADGREFEKTILIVSEILTMPGEKKKPRGAPKSKAKGKAEAEEPEEDDLSEKATEIIMGVLAEVGEAIPKKKLVPLVFKAEELAGDPDKNGIIKLIMDDDFMNAGPWEFDGTEVSLG